MPSGAKRITETVIEVLVLAFLVYLVYLSATIFPKVSMRQKSATMGFAMFVPQFAIILGQRADEPADDRRHPAQIS